MDFKLNSNYRNLDDLLILRPFPQIQSEQKNIPEVWTSYRNEMISKAGIAIFTFGNKKVDKNIINSSGMEEEFEICLNHNVIPIPIGATGYVSKSIWEKVTITYLTIIIIIINYIIKELRKDSLTKDELINNIIDAIDILQNL